MSHSKESIVKYNGDIKALADSMGLIAEILNEHYAIMNLSAGERSALSKRPQIEAVEEQKILSFLDHPDVPATGFTTPRQGGGGLTGRGVLIAILDSGIDYAHQDFINEDGTTRIISMWDQNAAGIPPKGFAIGSEYSQEQLNAVLAEGAAGSVPRPDTSGHGTALAGAAAGNGRASGGKYAGSAPEASLLIVRMAQMISAHFASDINLMRGVQYASDKAAALNMPLVINISYGTNQGAHDGSSLFEQYLDMMAERWKTAVVIPAGNEGDGGKHFQGTVITGSSIDAGFTIQSRLESLNITMFTSPEDQLELQIVDGRGNVSGTFDLNGDQTIVDEAAQVIMAVHPPAPCHADQMIRIILSDMSGNTLASTVWTIRIIGICVVSGDINLWLPVAEAAGVNTAFLFPETQTSLTIPATAPNVLSVGGFNSQINNPAEFSGRGFTANGVVKPEICAPAVNIMTTSPDGGYKRVSGTGAAAAITAGVCALMMQWGIVEGNDLHMYGQRLKTYLQAGAIMPSANRQVPDSAWGYGLLCLEKPVQLKSAQVIDTQEDISIPNIITRDELPLEINPATSEAYLNFMLQYDFNSRRIISEYPDILVSSILQDSYAIIHVPVALVPQYTDQVEVYAILERSRIFGLLANPALDEAGITAVKQPNLDLTGRGVLIGIVDTGIDYTLDTFQYENGETKILRIWDQTIETGDVNAIPEGFIYGTEYTREQINLAIASDNPYEIVPSYDEIGHGTFLTSLMAGRATDTGEEGAAPDAELVVVKLQQAKQVTLDNSAITTPGVNAYDSVDVLNGIEYLTDIARIEDRPLVICIGMGTSDSGHDGLSYIEQYLTRIANILNVIVVSAAGNEGDRGHHAAARLSGNEDMKEIEFNVAFSTTGLFMRLWAFAPDRLSVSLLSPLGSIVDRRKFTTNERVSYSFVIERSEIDIDYLYPNTKNGSQSIIIRILAPQLGLWKLRVYGDLIIDGRFNIWMPISSLWNSSTYFLQPDVNITVTTPATAPAVIAVGAYNSADDSIYVSSSRGPNRLDVQCPDFVAPGVNVTGVMPGGRNGTMTGTSVAAAITAGACALMLQWAVVEDNYPTINNYTMRTFLLIGLEQRPGIIYPDSLWGYGELNLINSFRNI